MGKTWFSFSSIEPHTAFHYAKFGPQGKEAWDPRWPVSWCTPTVSRCREPLQRGFFLIRLGRDNLGARCPGLLCLWSQDSFQ